MGQAQSVKSLAANPASVLGGAGLTGTITLSSPAGANGLSVNLVSDQPCVQFSSPVTVPAGQSSAKVSLTTTPVASTAFVGLSASANGTEAFAVVEVLAPKLKSLALTASTIGGGATASGTVTLGSPAPASGITVLLGASDPSIQVPGMVAIPSGASSVSFSVTTNPVPLNVAASIIAFTDSGAVSAGLTVLAPTVTKVSLSPSSLIGGATVTANVTLSSRAPSGFSVAVASSSPAAETPASASVAAGSTAAMFTFPTQYVSATVPAVITVGSGSKARTALLTLYAIKPVSIVLTPRALAGGKTFSGVVTLDAAAPPTGLNVALSDPDASVTLPPKLNVVGGATSATFEAQTSPVAASTPSVITASTGGGSATAQVVVQAPTPALTLNPSRLSPGATSLGTITLSGPAPTGGLVVKLSSANALATVPPSLTIPAGSSSATFSAVATQPPASGSVQITASLAASGATARLTIIGGLANSAWPKFHGDLQNTGLASGKGATGIVKWQLHVGSANFLGSSPVLGSDGTVYIGAEGDHHFYAINGATGAIKWSYLTGDSVDCTAAVGSNGLVYFGSRDFYLYALDAATGKLKWKFLTGGYVTGSPTIGSDGTVFFGSNDGNVYALDGATGALKWNYLTGGIVVGSPSIGFDGTVYFGSSDTYVYAVDGSTGRLRWKSRTRNGVYGAIAVGSDAVFFGVNDGFVYSMNAATGAWNWDIPTGDIVTSCPAVGLNGMIYCGSHDHSFYALDALTGAEKWTLTTGNTVESSAAIGPDGSVYVGSDDYWFYALNGTTGAVLWKFYVGGYVAPSPAIGSDGTIYIAGGDYVYAIK